LKKMKRKGVFLMNKLQNNKLKTKLEELKTTSKPLKKYVVEYVLEEFNNYDDIKDFFKDLSYGGCSSGMIGDLIYYKDTSDFFDNYEDEIEDLITLNMDRFGIETRPLFINSLNGSAENIAQEKNLLSWFAFEEVARDLSEELGFEK